MPNSKQVQWVDLLAWDPVFQKGTMCARVIWQDGRIRFEGELPLVNYLKDGLASYPDATMVYPEDGMKFLQTIVESFRSPTLMATDIQQGEEVSPFGDRSLSLKID